MHTKLFWKILALEEKDEGLLGKNLPSDAGDRFLARELRSRTPSATTEAARKDPNGATEILHATRTTKDSPLPNE